MYSAGIILAPGREKDYSVNQYILKTLRTRPRFWKREFHFEYATTNFGSVEAALTRLSIRKKCTHIFAVGSFMAAPIRRTLDSTPATRSVQIGIIDHEISENESDMDNIFGITFNETQLGVAAGKYSVQILSETLNKNPQELKVAFIGGADVPVSRRWAAGFRVGVSQAETNCSFDCRFLGYGSSSFDDPWTAYYATQYFLKIRMVRLIIQACGASALGVCRAISEHNANHRDDPAWLVCCDYLHWNRVHNISPHILCCVIRDIDLEIYKALGNDNADSSIKSNDFVVDEKLSAPLESGRIFVNKSIPAAGER